MTASERTRAKTKHPARRTLTLFIGLAFLGGCASSTSTRWVGPPIPGVGTACAPRAETKHFAEAGEAEQSMGRVVVTAAPESATSLVSRAWDKSRTNDRAGTVALFDLALTRPDSNQPIDRIQWSYGWAMFNLNEYSCALAHFDQARQSAPTQINWVPYTLAVTYWQMGARDVALRWYDESARNEPRCWIDARAAERCTRHWLRQERRALGELLTVWKRKRHEPAN